jgi:hypothetical protein
VTKTLPRKDAEQTPESVLRSKCFSANGKASEAANLQAQVPEFAERLAAEAVLILLSAFGEAWILQKMADGRRT